MVSSRSAYTLVIKLTVIPIIINLTTESLPLSYKTFAEFAEAKQCLEPLQGVCLLRVRIRVLTMDTFQLLLAVGVCFWIYFLWSRRRLYMMHFKIPGPMGLPILGIAFEYLITYKREF